MLPILLKLTKIIIRCGFPNFWEWQPCQSLCGALLTQYTVVLPNLYINLCYNIVTECSFNLSSIYKIAVNYITCNHLTSINDKIVTPCFDSLAIKHSPEVKDTSF